MVTTPDRPFRHVLITRFNTRRNALTDPPDGSWLNDRWALFDRFCIPSVLRQRCTDFHWLVFVDAGTPTSWQARVNRAAATAGFRPVYVDGPFNSTVAAQSIAEYRLDTAPFLITTRLDNDDALAPHFVADVQRAFRPRRLEFINLPLGYQLSDGRLFLRPYVASSFASLVESADNCPVRTVHFIDHHLIGQHPVRQVWSPPAWLQLVHGRNVANEVRGIPIAGAKAVARFGLVDIDTTPPLLRDRLTALALFAGRGLASAEARKRATSMLRTRIF